MTLNARSLERLRNGVQPALQMIVQRAAERSPIKFQVSEGLRTAARQRELVAAGKSQTQNSRHLTGHAVDLVVLNPDGSGNWDLANYRALNEDMQKAAAEFKVALTWGGNWKSLVDGPHWELDRKQHP